MSNIEPDAIINGKAIVFKTQPKRCDLQLEIYRMASGFEIIDELPQKKIHLGKKRHNCFGHHGQGNCSCEHCRSVREDRYCNCDFCNRTRRGE